jgi:DNA (cytosine-5)-methyltransferase 1
MGGVEDPRGRLFYEYIRVIRDKMPLFFVAENVPGIISKTHLPEFEKIIHHLGRQGYRVVYKLLDARGYGVPQERKRVIIVGYSEKLGKTFAFPEEAHSKSPIDLPSGRKTRPWVALRGAIGDLPESVPVAWNKANANLSVPNHEHVTGGFSPIYMSRNRLRGWDEQSYTIQASGRHAPLHPSSSKMIKLGKDVWGFESSSPAYRRLSIRECARIQTFPDDFLFYYDRASDGYKMVGNAVPVKLAEAIAAQIKCDLYPAEK